MKRLLFNFLILMIPFFGMAQEGTFKAGLIGGFNASQIDGDLLAGYNKPGLHVGGVVGVQIAERWRPSIEFLYTQKGSRRSTDEQLTKPYTNISLHYVEIPLIMNYIDGGFMLNAGLSYGRLVRLKELTLSEIDEIEKEGDRLRDNNFNFLAGLGYFINDNIGVEVRYSYSPISITDWADTGTAFTEPYILKSLSFRAVYMF
ncbi:MAG: outer membrane beta-barrel protein [Saprospiraceae bacterium]